MLFAVESLRIAVSADIQVRGLSTESQPLLLMEEACHEACEIESAAIRKVKGLGRDSAELMTPERPLSFSNCLVTTRQSFVLFLTKAIRPIFGIVPNPRGKVRTRYEGSTNGFVAFGRDSGKCDE